MDIIAKLTTLKNKVEEAKTNYERAKGRMEAADKALLDAGFKSVTDLEATISDHEKMLNKLKVELEERTNSFIESYGELLK